MQRLRLRALVAQMLLLTALSVFIPVARADKNDHPDCNLNWSGNRDGWFVNNPTEDVIGGDCGNHFVII